MSLESVRVLDDAAATATIVGGIGILRLRDARPGTSASTSPSPTARRGHRHRPHHDAARDAPPQLATAPVVAFVHPQEDATLDVFSAVSNPTRRVLLLSDVVAAETTEPRSRWTRWVRTYLRVSGTTATSAPGASAR
jgi:hypothetical protein